MRARSNNDRSGRRQATPRRERSSYRSEDHHPTEMLGKAVAHTALAKRSAASTDVVLVAIDYATFAAQKKVILDSMDANNVIKFFHSVDGSPIISTQYKKVVPPPRFGFVLFDPHSGRYVFPGVQETDKPTAVLSSRTSNRSMRPSTTIGPPSRTGTPRRTSTTRR